MSKTQPAAANPRRGKPMTPATPELGYEVIIHWSADDKVYVAEVPELPGCMTHGPTHQEAARQAELAMALWIDVARETGRAVPVPKGRRLLFA